MPSSVKVGWRPPSRDLMRSYSSAVSPWSRRTSGVMAKVAVDMWGSSIVAFSGCSCTELFLSIRNLLAAKIAEELLAKLGYVGTAPRLSWTQLLLAHCRKKAVELRSTGQPRAAVPTC